MAGTIGELFAKEPRQWGLRGDPWLWEAFARRSEGLELPASRGVLEGTLRQWFGAEVGVALSSPHHDTVFVERFAHGGMSSGHVSLSWWREKGMPLLLRRSSLPGLRFSMRTTVEADWPAVRSLRIENATDNPISCGATLETTMAMTEDDWRLRARRGASTSATSLVAVDAGSGRWLGMMSAQEEGDGAGCLLTGVFVVPGARGRSAGVGDALLGEVLAWCAGRSSPLRLWVDEGPEGTAARRFYERHGFVRTTGRQPIGFVPGNLVEMELVRRGDGGPRRAP